MKLKEKYDDNKIDEIEVLEQAKTELKKKYEIDISIVSLRNIWKNNISYV
jgi:hypothetical protein